MAVLTPIFAYEIISLLLFIIILIYFWFQHKFTYWLKRGVIGPNPVFPFGNIQDVIKRKVQFFQPYCDSYYKYKGVPYVGMYSFYRPILSINSPEIARLVLIKDYDNFEAHGIFSGGVGDPLAGHLFNLYGKPWRMLRSKMSPTFTGAKLKNLYPFVEEISNKALGYADKLTKEGKAINFSEFYAKYSMEIIASVGFGVEFNGIEDLDTEFYRRGHEYFEPQSLYWTFTRAFAFMLPNLFKKLKIRRINPAIVRFFYNLVQETVEYRQKHSYKRNDFLQTLIDLKNGNGSVETDFHFSMDDVAANTMLYMFAGYETSATTGQFAAYQLARNPHIQNKAREEVRTILAKYGGECTYEAQNEMTYLNMVLDETMRVNPPMRALFRRCTKEYRVPDADLTIEKGTLIFIPIQAIQMDPDIFPEPEKFDPERFSLQNKAKMHPCHWMPFGEGPRKCLGLRQGYIQSKLGLVKILSKYELVLDNRTPTPMKIKASALGSAPDGGVWLRLRTLKD